MMIEPKTYWDAMSRDLGIEIVHPFKTILPLGRFVTADAVIADFGAKKGVLIFSKDEDVDGHEQELQELGYGYSVFSMTGSDEYCREDAIEMLRDWGWSNEKHTPPSWLE